LKKLNVPGATPDATVEIAKKLGIPDAAIEMLTATDAYSVGLRDAWFVHIAYMDMAVSMPTWMGAYQKAMDGNAENVEAGNEKEAIDFADTMVRTTQSAGAAKDLAAVQRGTEAHRIFTMFYTYFSLLFNQFGKTHNEFRMTRNLPKLLGSLALLWWIPAALEDTLLGRGPGDDDDEKWAQFIAKKELTYPFQSVILLRDIANGADKFGYSPSAAFGGMEELARAANVGAKLVTGEKEDITRRDVKGLALTAGYVIGLPTRQAWLTSESLYDWVTGENPPEDFMEGIWRTAVTGVKK